MKSSCASLWLSAVVALGCFASNSSVFAQDITTVTVTNTSASEQASPVTTLGHVFKAGDVPAGTTLSAKLADNTVIPLQVDKKALHGDGSLRHAILSMQLPNLAGNASTRVTLTTQPDVTRGNAVSLDALLATSFDARASLTVDGVLHTASARTLLQALPATVPAKNMWLSGSLVSEWLVGGPVKTADGTPHPHLTAYFHVRAYAGDPINRVRVDVVIENNWTRVSNPSDFTYDVTLSVGNSVYSKAALTHFTRARWHKTFWWGSDPTLYVAYDKTYIQDTRAVPKYKDVTPSEATLAGPLTGLEPMQLGDNRSYMATTGENSMIGPLPQWVALYLVSMDRRSYLATLRNADGGGTYNAHYRNEVTGYPATTDDYPDMQIGNNSTTWVPAVVSTSPHEWDDSHQPALAYVPYMMSGDYYYLEELQFWAEANMLVTSAGTRQSQIGLQVRGQAWSLRTLGEAAYITPDNHALKTHLVKKVKYYLSQYDQNYTNNSAANKLGVLWSADDQVSQSKLSNGYFTVWMDDYFTWAVGHLVELGFNEAIPLRNWKLKFVTDRMGGDLSAGQYCWQVATPSQLRMGEDLTWFPDITTVYAINFPVELRNLTCGTQAYADYIKANRDEPGFLTNEMTPYGNDPEGHPAKTQPALAIAVDAGIANADIGWARMSTRADPPDFSSNPKYAVVPRLLSGPLVAFTATPSVVTPGATATLSWSTDGAQTCVASGGWTGGRETSGIASSGALTATQTYTLTCTGTTGTQARTIEIMVNTSTGGGSGLSNTNNSQKKSAGGGALDLLLVGFLLLKISRARFTYVRNVRAVTGK